jgi:hypothetical protein
LIAAFAVGGIAAGYGVRPDRALTSVFPPAAAARPESDGFVVEDASDRAFNCINGATKLGEQPVAHQLEDATVVTGYLGFE